jgi:hypothetical protein
MTDISTLRTWLSQAELARHQLLTGSMVERLQHGDEMTAYTPANIDKLDAYIASLRSQIAGSDGTASERRRPINFTY